MVLGFCFLIIINNGIANEATVSYNKTRKGYNPVNIISADYEKSFDKFHYGEAAGHTDAKAHDIK